ncbi:MAG TPA: hypothetical protein VKM55_08810 [Candidatus Lokiarchaeia archaeon]|nr:hypothetical protein [Candidatus Lokiarchaeia archaeon]
MSAVSTGSQATFASMGSIITRIAKYENAAFPFAIIASLVILSGASLHSEAAVIVGIVIAAPLVIIFIQVQLFTRELMNAMETIGTGNNIPQFVMFARFLFNSIAVGFIAFFWAIICTIIMATPFLFTATLPWYPTNPDAISASVAGEITISLVSIIIGFLYMPHAFKSWKFVDDYFVILHDPWPRDIGLAGVKKILDSYKAALVTTIFTIPALGGYYAVVWTLPIIIITTLVACGKYIQGLYRVGAAFIRVQTIPLYLTSNAPAANRPVNTSHGTTQQVTPPPPILRYQPSQALYAGASSTQRQASRPATNPSLVADNDISRDLLVRSNVFLQTISQDPSAARVQAISTPNPATNAASTTPISSSTPVNPSSTATRSSYKGTRCKYCLAELPETIPAKCPSCNGVLLDFTANEH